MNNAIRIHHQPSDEEKEKYRQLRDLIDTEKDDIIAEGRRHKAVHDDTVQCLRQAVALLKQERIRQKMDLSSVSQQIGLDEEALIQLESEPQPALPISTLIRYAQSLGMRMQITFAKAE